MVLKIRLARFGRRHAPFYNIVVTHARTARGSKPLEVLGTFDPTPKLPLSTTEVETRRDRAPYKDVKLDVARARYWLGVGAQPSDPAWKLLGMIGLVVPRVRGREIIPIEEPAQENSSAQPEVGGKNNTTKGRKRAATELQGGKDEQATAAQTA